MRLLPRLFFKLKHLCVLLSLIFLTPVNVLAEVAEDQKKFYDILIISNPIQSSYRKELFTTNIDGELVINPAKISGNSILLRIQNCLLTDLQSNAGGANSALYRNTAEDMQHVLKVKKFYQDYAQIDQLHSSSFQILDDLLQKYYSNYEYRFECSRGQVSPNRVGAKLNTGSNDFSMIPRYMLDLVNVSKAYGRDIKEADIFSVIKYDQLLSMNQQLAEKKKKKDDAYIKRKQELEELANKKSLDYTYELLFRKNDEIRPCTTSRTKAHSILGHVILHKKFYKQEPNDKFYKVFKNIESAYQNIKQKNNCTVYIDFPENIYKLHNALKRDNIRSTVGPRLESLKGKKTYVTHHGYKSIEEYDLVWALDVKKELVRELAKFKIDSIEKYNKIQEKMLKSSYSENKNVRDVLSYLSDLKEARKKGIDILKQRDIRLLALKKEREAQAAKREKQKIAYAKKYPYYAVLSCEANGSHANIAACLSGGQYGADTELTLNGKIYKAYNINQAGRENSEGLSFDLPNDFSIIAQNANDFLILKLVITNRLTNKIVYQKEVGQYGVIKISE